MLLPVAPIALVFLLSAGDSLSAASPARPYTVENYDASIRADLAQQLLYGEVTIRFHGLGDIAVSALEFDAGGLKVTSVREGESSQSFEQNRRSLFVVLTRPVHPDEQRTIAVRYQAGPASGLKFFPDQIVASDVSDWMPSSDLSGERSTLHLTLTAPADMKAAASGQLGNARAGDGQNITEWRLDSPTEPSRFGFALGSFEENSADAGGVKLRVLGAGAQFADLAAAAIRYFTDRTGKPYPGQVYTQVFTKADRAGSFAAGLTLLPESYARKLEKQPDELRLLADALAHQWFGIGVTTRSWSDLWLTEGVSAFMADAFLGQKFGKERFDRELQHSREIYDQLRAGGRDRPLSDSDRTTRQDADGGVPEYKGAWFLYLLDQFVGDSAFWSGIRMYAGNEWGQAATSEDFQRAFEAGAADSGNAGRNEGKKGASGPRNGKSKTTLDNMFEMWVYGIANQTPGRKSR
jgi:aminopeptidase N